MDYDLVVLGAGPGGYVAAIRAAQLGAKTAIIEERELGGVCLNRGCIPTKALIHSAHLFSLARRGAEFGIQTGEVGVDYARVTDRMRKVIEKLRGGVQMLMKKNKIEVIQGRGALADAHTLEVVRNGEKRKVTAEKILIATGSEPLRLPGFPFDETTVITSDEALKLTKLPKSILVVGGGYIGAEWASIFQQYGVKVIVVEMMDQLLPRGDADVAKELFRHFKKLGIETHLETKVESVEKTAGGVTAKLSNGKAIETEVLLVSVGRSVNSRNIGLEAVGVKTERGAIVIDAQCRTNVPSIYAIGDVTAKLMLAHVATRQGIVAAEAAMGHAAKMDYRVIPACVFMDIEIGSVGMTAAEAAAAGREVKEAKFPFQALGKAIAIGETAGWCKIIADARSGEVLGVHIIGPSASALIAEAALAMQMEATVETIAETIHAHPTLPEVMSEGAEAWLGRAIHA